MERVKQEYTEAITTEATEFIARLSGFWRLVGQLFAEVVVDRQGT